MHFLNSIYWKKVKEALGNKVYDAGGTWFQTTPIPLINKSIGYIPRADLNKVNLQEIYNKAKEAGCVYVSIDPDNAKTIDGEGITEVNSHESTVKINKGRPTQLQRTVIINLEKREEELLAAMKQKHRYNLKIAKKNNVEIKISQSEDALNEFLKLHEETVSRQEYNDRDSEYIKKVWEVLNESSVVSHQKPVTYIATAYYQQIPLGSWFLIGFGDTLYYPYGGSSDLHKKVMPIYLLVWEVIKFGQNHGYKKLDLMGIQKDKSDGYSRFKDGFGGDEVEYEDTIDLVINKFWYSILKVFFRFR
ncbi:MAG: peptidoglycan bridge formation glycyltransferase FemA/FemB family protein [Candidatus Dojkabacteria bacterium]